MDDSQPAAARAASADPHDDLLLPFRTVLSSVEGRVVRLGAVVDEVLSRHDYPEPAARVLGEALALAAMLGAALGTTGRLIVEARTSGIVRSLAVHYEAPGKLRGYIDFDRERLAAAERERTSAGSAKSLAMLGAGHLAITAEPGAGRDSYQGIVALEAGGVAEAAAAYFRQSEQLPTFLRLAVARHYAGERGGGRGQWHWRAGGLLIQHLTAREDDTNASHDAAGAGAMPSSAASDADESWRRARHLASTVEDHELLDPVLSSERLLLRLFHEEGVRVKPAITLTAYCRCSRERIESFLTQFTADDLADLREPDGSVVVTCEFCGRRYPFAGTDMR